MTAAILCVIALVVASICAHRRSRRCDRRDAPAPEPAPYRLWRDGNEALEEARRERLELDRGLDEHSRS